MGAEPATDEITTGNGGGAITSSRFVSFIGELKVMGRGGGRTTVIGASVKVLGRDVGPLAPAFVGVFEICPL